MNWLLFTEIVAALSIAFAFAAFARRLADFEALGRPADRAAPKGDPAAGVRYALTLGLAPWAKESTRRHLLAYLRGIAFHLGIFLGLALLVGGPWLALLPAGWRSGLAALAGLGALFGLAGLLARLVEPNLRALSTPDDYFAVALVSLFLASGAVALLNLALRPLFYLVGATLLVYAPLGKVRHCLYFAYSRLFYGLWTGRRAVRSAPHGRPMRVTQ